MAAEEKGDDNHDEVQEDGYDEENDNEYYCDCFADDDDDDSRLLLLALVLVSPAVCCRIVGLEPLWDQTPFEHDTSSLHDLRSAAPPTFVHEPGPGPANPSRLLRRQRILPLRVAASASSNRPTGMFRTTNNEALHVRKTALEVLQLSHQSNTARNPAGWQLEL